MITQNKKYLKKKNQDKISEGIENILDKICCDSENYGKGHEIVANYSNFDSIDEW